MLYGGLIASIICFLIALVYFFYSKVYQAFSYLSHRGRNITSGNRRKNTKTSDSKIKVIQNTNNSPIGSEVTELLEMLPSDDFTEILCDDSTEVLE